MIKLYIYNIIFLLFSFLLFLQLLHYLARDVECFGVSGSNSCPVVARRSEIYPRYYFITVWLKRLLDENLEL